jgi:hypothetical protein
MEQGYGVSHSAEHSANNQFNQFQRTNCQISNLEREMLLNNKNVVNGTMNNWVKVILTALSVLIPGLGQIVGIIAGLIFVGNDLDYDKRTFGAALLTVSIITFLILSIFWFIMALALGPRLY